jgi:2'-hydroxyisoflavone reductase
MDEAYLLNRGVQPWSELPLWIPDADNGIFEVRNDKAIAKGLTFRHLEATVRDTLEWDRHRPMDETMKAGLPRERERELLNDAPYPAH